MIRPFQIGDLLLVQRLSSQATQLNAIQALLRPRTAASTAISSVIPWAGANANTYVLKQDENSLARDGLIQAQKRPGRPEADITLLAPALDSSRGHPAIWEKLIAHYAQEAVTQNISRIYVDVPDQPLLVNTFGQAGFKIYTRQTIWRLAPQDVRQDLQHSTASNSIWGAPDKQSTVRVQRSEDEWELQKLYSRVTPSDVQQAEGMAGYNAIDGEEQSVKPLILDWWQSSNVSKLVLFEKDQLHGCLLIGRTAQATWMRMLVDGLRPDPTHIQSLLYHGLRFVHAQTVRNPIYIGVRGYHGDLSSHLADFGFAPFTDRARMVRQVHAWVREPARQRMPTLEVVGKAVPTSFSVPNVSVPNPSTGPVTHSEQKAAVSGYSPHKSEATHRTILP